MSQKDLYFITGFLGVGKTTFMCNLIHELKDKKLQIIINEFGKVGIDGKLIESLGIAVDEINNGSILCSCRIDKFSEVLEQAANGNSQVIIIESSGLTDPSNLAKVLNECKSKNNINYKGCICLVDSKRFYKVYDTATVVKKQLYAGDLIIINKCDLVDVAQLKKTKETISALRPDITIRETSFGKIKKEWIENLNIKTDASDVNLIQVADITVKKYLIKIDESMDISKFKKFIKIFLNETFRVKGFVEFNSIIYYLDCVGNIFKMNQISIENVEQDQINKIVVLAGKGLNTKSAIKDAIAVYPLAALL